MPGLRYPGQSDDMSAFGLPNLTQSQEDGEKPGGFSFGDFGSALSSLLPGGEKSVGIANAFDIGAGAVGSLFKGIGSKLAGTAMGKAAMANPVGAVLGTVQAIGNVLGKTKQAQKDYDKYGKMIESTEESVGEARKLTDASKEVAEEDRDIGFEVAGMKDERTLDAIYKKGGQSRAATGGLVSGEIEYDIAQAESDVLEGGMQTSETLARGYEKNVAQADAQFTSFEDKARKQIEQLTATQRGIKTKWYQNVV